MTRRAVVAAVALLLGYAAPASASLIDLSGATVTADYHWPNLGTIQFASGPAVVGAGLEFNNLGGFGIGISPTADFSATNILVTYPVGYGLAGVGTFDGWVFSVVGGLAPPIIGVSLAGTNIPGFTAARLSFNATQVFADQLGLGSWGPNTSFSVNLEFGDAVPEPATLMLLGSGLMAACVRMRRTRRV
jgi:hypothetical protein